MRFVADAIAISKGSLTEVVTALQTRALVQRRTPDSDRRSVLISITDPGQALVVQAIPEVNDVESQILASLAAPTKRQLTAIHPRPQSFRSERTDSSNSWRQ